MTDLFRSASGPFFALGLTVLIVACLALTRDYAVPVAVAVLIWFLINALADALGRAPLVGAVAGRALRQLISVLILFGLIGLAVRIVAGNIASLSEGFTGEERAILVRVEGLAAALGFEIAITREAVLSLLEIDMLIGMAVATLQGLVSDIALVFLYVLFLLIDERFYGAKLAALVPDPERRGRIQASLARIGAETRAYLWLMTLISLGVAVMTYLAASAVGLEGAGFWGFLAFALNFIPYIGSAVAVTLPLILSLLQFGEIGTFLLLLALLAAAQVFVGNFVEPRVTGKSLNLSPVVIVMALSAWGAIWGITGMFLSVPITVMLTIVCAAIPSTRFVAIALSQTGDLGDMVPPPSDRAKRESA